MMNDESANSVTTTTTTTEAAIVVDHDNDEKMGTRSTIAPSSFVDGGAPLRYRT
jgi:hypothetical protein